ncbi:MAG: hypothetical protein EKK42_20195 [Pseudonocardiaceae bacterium]|nr:MAG: hypothetical protein EKK42_20195 [Pseudonocardiaceae bacterium]
MSLLDEADVDVVAFRPERAGESVEGVVTYIGVTDSEYTTDEIPVITLKTDDDVLRGIRGYHKNLREDIAKVDLRIGDRLAVRYDGKKPTKDGKRSYHAYTVRKAPGAAADADVAPF